MAIIITTSSPRELLSEIKAAISEKKVRTWTCDSDGDFTHSTDQWARKAWFRPSVGADGLIFSILTPRGTSMNRTTYGIFHGRFIEMLLTHFDERFSRALASAMPERGDVVKDVS